MLGDNGTKTSKAAKVFRWLGFIALFLLIFAFGGRYSHPDPEKSPQVLIYLRNLISWLFS